ncbi:Lrp/AsnC family transcriptional regulator [Paenibacillus sp.]|uniref:Lrp/AsnC family transcriptional regulator n=1 Tax=Paenibacillus sp. TaxID=58172 RepID=UPI002D2E1F8B|nr:Lrp/AsnC family transcriptional regulator [Paenibacillus sp.]HZG57250.1 Lrp/AsnC family transcriptional regulator [Paenibacillus sp.]
MDNTDKEILLALQEQGRISMTELGKLVGLTAPAVTERVKKLEDRGVITGYRAVVNAEALGKSLCAFILFDSKRCEEFRAFCAGHPSVVECHRLAGQYSYLVKVVTESIRSLEQFIDAALPYGQSSTLITLSSPVEFRPLA